MRLRTGARLIGTQSTVTVGPLLVVLGVLVALMNAGTADPYWLDLSSKATIPVLFLAPGFAALSAWDAARWRVLAACAVRSWPAIAVRQLALVAAGTGITFAATLAILVATNAPAAGFPRLDVLILGVLATTSYAAVGFAIGRFLPRLVAAPLAFVAVWIWVAYTPAVQPFWLRNVTGNLGTSCCAIDTQLAPHALLAPASLTVALLIAVMIALWPRPFRARWAVSGLAVALGATLAAHLASPLGADPVEARRGTQHCIEDAGTTWCAWPEHADELRDGVPSLARAASALRRTGLAVPTTLRENTPSAGGWSFSLSTSDPAERGRAFVTSPLADLPPACTDSNGGDWPAGEYLGAATAWLTVAAGGDSSEAARANDIPIAEMSSLLAESRDQQVAWFYRVRNAMQSCDPVS